MQITTRFSIGDKVWPVDSEQETVRVPCLACEGQGKVLDGMGERTIYCQKTGCYNGSHTIRMTPRAVVRGPHTVGKVSFDMYTAREGEQEQYMCEETGIGTGRVYYGNRLFGSPEEAAAFAAAWTIELAWDAAIAWEKYLKLERRGKARKDAVTQARYEAERLKEAKRHAAGHDSQCEARWIEPYRDPYGGENSRAGFFTHCECAYRLEQDLP